MNDNYYEDIKGLYIRTSYISIPHLTQFPKAGIIPIFICRYMNPMCSMYEGTAVHFPELSPSKELFYDIKHRRISKDEYNSRYLEEQKDLDIPKLLFRFYSLINAANARGVCMMCYEKDRDVCHRKLLADKINSTKILDDEIRELLL